jgi:cytochrome c553
MPITEALHNNHKSIAAGGVIAFADSHGRAGGCQGCHPAHRSDGNMNGYPITLAGANAQAFSDNRDGTGGCFVGRDVHSNPGKDSDGAETPAHLNAVGQYLADNVFNDPGSDGGALGIWCTNCHNQLGQEIWKAENMSDLVHGIGINNVRGQPTLAAVAAAVGTTEAQAISWLDPKNTNPSDDSFAIWESDPGLCDYVASLAGAQPFNPAQDGNVAVVEVVIGGSGAGSCSNSANGNAVAVPVDCGFVTFDICGSTDGDGDFNVNLVGNTVPDAGGFGGAFCTTPDCVASAQASLGSCTLAPGDNCAVPVPFSAATDGRDHWLASGEPHCADCHEAPFTEQSGNINAYPPFNYPRKASLMRYSRGHQDISCQGCHESIHGLYPVTPSIDNTSYAQAAALNHDGSHGPLKCGACHAVDGQGIPNFMNATRAVYSVPGYGGPGINSFDEAVAWAHTYTEEQSVLDTTCQNCHGVQGSNWSQVSPNNETYMRHAMRNPPRGSRQMMDKAEMEVNGGVVFGFNPDGTANNAQRQTACSTCHGQELGQQSCNNTWRNHLTQGRVSQALWEAVSPVSADGTNCGW